MTVMEILQIHGDGKLVPVGWYLMLWDPQKKIWWDYRVNGSQCEFYGSPQTQKVNPTASFIHDEGFLYFTDDYCILLSVNRFAARFTPLFVAFQPSTFWLVDYSTSKDGNKLWTLKMTGYGMEV